MSCKTSVKIYEDFIQGKHQLQNKWLRSSGSDAYYHCTSDPYGHMQFPLEGPFTSIASARMSLCDYQYTFKTGKEFHLETEL